MRKSVDGADKRSPAGVHPATGLGMRIYPAPVLGSICLPAIRGRANGLTARVLEGNPRDTLLRGMRPYVEARLAAGVPLKHMARHWLDLFHACPGGRAFRRVLSEGAHLPGAGWALVETALAQTRRQLSR